LFTITGDTSIIGFTIGGKGSNKIGKKISLRLQWRWYRLWCIYSIITSVKL